MEITYLNKCPKCQTGDGRGRKNQTGAWTQTLFENELLALNVGLVSSRPYRPQTNGKLERSHRSL